MSDEKYCYIVVDITKPKTYKANSFEEAKKIIEPLKAQGHDVCFECKKTKKSNSI